ncbi:hypothetical protein X474_00810 [Dethiosulfatarculus sandiegensis]|uniref:Uncharacterized protein n=1 Tax=Dethiosulfatarculus sandiegensis TaxID=1429043 RepID=A0A0D2JD01_9BACT|nr:hypothetical protein X474_00810 [Dethiosulfatarculus sandiegensis]
MKFRRGPAAVTGNENRSKQGLKALMTRPGL